MELGRRLHLLVAAVWPVRTLLPWRGPRGWARLPAVLRPDPGALSDPDFLRLHLAVRTGVGVLGAGCLLRGVRNGDVRRGTLGEGLAQYELPEWPDPFWVDVRSDTALGGWGEPPRDFAVRLRFADLEQARLAQAGDLDLLAEIGAGRLRVDGRLPLIDGLHTVMDRVERILEGP